MQLVITVLKWERIVMAVVCCTTKIGQLVDGLRELYYYYEPDEPAPERHFFVKPPLDVPYRTHHLSLTTVESSFWRDNLAFREYMLRHTDEASRYGALKNGGLPEIGIVGNSRRGLIGAYSLSAPMSAVLGLRIAM